MKLYKYSGVIGEKIEHPKLIYDHIRYDDAVAVIKQREPHCFYVRIIGPCPAGSYHFDYGSWSNFYVLTDKELTDEDTEVTEN